MTTPNEMHNAMVALGEMHNALVALGEAAEVYGTAHAKANEARRAETHAINRLNEAQKIVDLLVAAAKKAAPKESDWGRSPSIPV